MASPRKEPMSEFQDLASIGEESPTAKVHRIVTGLSPIKPSSGKPFLEGTFSDCGRSLRLVGFNSEQQKKLATFQDNEEPVALTNCSLTRGKWGDDLEIIVKDSTTVMKSPKKYTLDGVKKNVEVKVSVDITLSEPQDQVRYKKVNVCGKVIRIDDIERLQDGRRLQPVIIADSGGTAKFTLWENEIGALEVEHSYKFTNMMVTSYAEIRGLTYPKQGGKFELIEDIGNVQAAENAPKTHSLSNAIVVAVRSFKSCRTCVVCKGEVESTQDFARCVSCNTLQRIDRCKMQVAAKLMIEANEFPITLNVYDQILAEIAKTTLANVSEEALLIAPRFSLIQAA